MIPRWCLVMFFSTSCQAAIPQGYFSQPLYVLLSCWTAFPQQCSALFHDIVLSCDSRAMFGFVFLQHPADQRFPVPFVLQTCNFGRCLALFSPTTFCRASCFIAISWFYPWNAMLFEVTLRFYPLQEFSCDGGVLLVDSPLPGSWWQCFMTSLACFPISVHDIFKPPIIKTNDHC